MKKGLLLLLVLSSVFVQAQTTLKEALFSGKLKNQPGTVIRNGDDLSSKIDTAQKATPGEAATTSAIDSSAQSVTGQTDTAATVTTDNARVAADSTTTAAPEAAPASAAAPKNNNTIWKTYMDSVASTLKTEVLASKKVKRGDYYVLVTYTIGTDGQTTVSDVAVSPENDYLHEQIKARLNVDTPQLAPVLNGAGTPRKAIKKYNFTLSKE